MTSQSPKKLKELFNRNRKMVEANKTISWWCKKIRHRGRKQKTLHQWTYNINRLPQARKYRRLKMFRKMLGPSRHCAPLCRICFQGRVSLIGKKSVRSSCSLLLRRRPHTYEEGSLSIANRARSNYCCSRRRKAIAALVRKGKTQKWSSSCTWMRRYEWERGWRLWVPRRNHRLQLPLSAYRQLQPQP